MSVLLLLVAFPAFGATLTLDEALADAHANPDRMAAEARAVASQAAERATKADALPSVSGSGSATVGGTVGSTTAGTWKAGLQADQRLYDFGATPSAIRAATHTAEAAHADVDEAVISVDLAVRQAFFAAAAAKALVAVADEALANQDKHLAQVQAFVTVGTRAPIDLAKAKTDRANVLVAQIRARGDYQSAQAALAAAIGREVPLDADPDDTPFPAVDGEDTPVQLLFEDAMKRRPDMLASAQRGAAEFETYLGARAALAPSLDAVGATDASGSAGLTAGAASSPALAWDVGLQLAVPIYTGGAKRAEIAQDHASEMALDAETTALAVQIRLEIAQAQVAVVTDRAAVEAADDAVDAARTQLDLAQGRYDAGAGSAIELSDAQLGLRNAEAQRVGTVYDLASARAKLIAALGRP